MFRISYKCGAIQLFFNLKFLNMPSSQKPLPFFFVGKAVTNERINNYAVNKHNLLSQAIGKPDTKNIWYSKEHLAKLLEEIELAGGDGIRIHIGMYEASHEFSGQLCLLMTTTREVLSGETVIHKNVFIEDEPDFSQRSVLPRSGAFPGNDQLSGKRDFNYGSPCPPRCEPPPPPGD
jgi:hypothetical protein